MKVSGDFEEFYIPSKAIFAKKTSPRKNGVFFVEQLNRKKKQHPQDICGKVSVRHPCL